MVGVEASKRHIERNKLFQMRPDEIEYSPQGILASRENRYDVQLRSWLARLPHLARSP